MAKSKEGKIEAYLVEQVEAAGGLIRKARWLCRKGCPDRFVAFPSSGWYGLVEVKPPDRPKLDPHQEREAKRLRAAKVPVVVLSTEEGVRAFVGAMSK